MVSIHLNWCFFTLKLLLFSYLVCCLLCFCFVVWLKTSVKSRGRMRYPLSLQSHLSPVFNFLYIVFNWVMCFTSPLLQWNVRTLNLRESCINIIMGEWYFYWLRLTCFSFWVLKHTYALSKHQWHLENLRFHKSFALHNEETLGVWASKYINCS